MGEDITLSDNHYLGDENGYTERRSNTPTRRVGLPDLRDSAIERRIGPYDRRAATKDKSITIVTCSGEYKGTINLNTAPALVDRISDFFIKSDIAFVTLHNANVRGEMRKTTLVNIQDIAPHQNSRRFSHGFSDLNMLGARSFGR